MKQKFITYLGINIYINKLIINHKLLTKNETNYM